jgi:hypothetical protein
MERRSEASMESLRGLEASMENLLERTARAWCRAMHDEIYRPANGVYRCQTCLREYSVPWVESETHAQLPQPERLLAAHERLTEATAAR